MRGIRIRSIPANQNPTPRPTTSYSRPVTAARPSSSCGPTGLWRNDTNILDDDANSVFEDAISESYLKQQYPDQDIADLEIVSLVIDTSYQSVLDLGDLLPKMTKLYLDNSKLLTVRDLGTGLRHLQVLSLNNCGLNELDGIAMLSSLKCLFARDNFISDINALAMHESLEELDLHGNRITDISIGDILSTCQKLQKLFLTHNPISRAPKYRLIMTAMIPQIEFLDSTLVDQNARNKISNGMILEAASAMQLEQEELDDERRMEMAILGDEFNTAMGYLPSNGNDLTRSETSDRFPENSGHGVCPDTGSDLTHGSSVVLAGNMATAMRRRRQSTPPWETDSKGISSDSSALETLDSALAKGASQRGREGYVPYYGEGDITALVLKNSETSPRTLRSQKKKSSQTLLSSSFDAELGLGGYDEEPLGAFPLLEVESASRPRTRGLASPQSAGGSRQRTPSPGSARSRSRNGLPPSSPPIQRNASRPSSTQGSIASGIAVRTPSAPFKVLVPIASRNDEEDFVSRVASNRRQEKERQGAEEGDKLSRHPRVNDIWDVSDDSSDEEAASGVGSRNKGKNSSSSNRHSIVHRDSVRRGSPSSSSGSGYVSKDAEELAVDHLSRRKMCHDNVYAHKTAASSNTMKVFTSRSPPFSENEKQEESSATLLASSASPDRSKRTNTLANVAGRSLGFDLQGSLAAINQWVEEMDSEEEEEDEEEQLMETHRKSGNTLFHRSIPSRCQSSSQRILSRDRILDMCTRGDEDKASHSLDQQDEVANSSEAYEENDVLFFDNNIDRTLPLSLPLSLSLSVDRLESPSPQTNQTKTKSPTKKPRPTVSLPRGEVQVSAGHPHDASASSAPSPAPAPAPSPSPLCAVQLSDDTLVTMLSQPPKSIPQMRTKSSFQDFFRGITEERMKQLLHRAYGNLNDLEREVKVRKRMELLAGVLSGGHDESLV